MAFAPLSLPLHEAAPVFAVLLAVVLVAPLLARALRVPELVALLLGGTLVGPAGLGLLEREGAVALLGGAGLLYLMFLAGLELDLDLFRSRRGASVRFGALTFVLPLVLGTGVALLLGFAILPAVLLGSCWSSHTLLAYPRFRRAGTAEHPAVAAAVGATIITDTLALLVLAVVVRAHLGDLGPMFWATFLPAFGGLVALTLWGLPRLARRFLAGPGQDPVARLVFVLLCLFVVSAVTELVGVEPILGAFLVGLALNRSVPNGGALMARVELLGSSLFVPLFLVATGMLVDPAIIVRPATLVTGLAFAATAMVGKLLAAVLAGVWLRADRDEVAAMFALSNAQAAATLAAVVVAVEVGLLGTQVVDAVVLVVLITCVTAAVVADRAAPRLTRPSRLRPLGTTVVAPVVNPASAHGLLGIAAAFARADGGVVVPLVVVPTGTDPSTVDLRRGLLDELTVEAQSAGAEARPLLRIDATPADGVLHTVAEVDASLLVLGWRGRAASHGDRLGGAVDQLLESARVPVLVVQDGDGPVGRVLVVLDGSLARVRGRPPLLLALRAAAVVAADRRVPLVVASNVDDEDVLAAVRATDGAELLPLLGDGRSGLVGRLARPDDLVVLPTLGDAGSLRTLVRGALREMPQGAAVVVAASHRPRVVPPPATPQAPAGAARRRPATG